MYTKVWFPYDLQTLQKKLNNPYHHWCLNNSYDSRDRAQVYLCDHRNNHYILAGMHTYINIFNYDCYDVLWLIDTSLIQFLLQ